MTIRTFLGCLAAGIAIAGAVPAGAAEGSDVSGLVRELGLREAAAPVRERPGWRKPAKIAVLIDRPSRLDWLKAEVKGVEIVPFQTPRQGLTVAAEADAVVGPCAVELVQAAPRMQWFHSLNAGIDECASALSAMPQPPLITNMQRVSGEAIATHVMGVMLMLARGYPEYLKAQERGEWQPRAVPFGRIWDLNGRTMLVAGLGGIGTEVARLAHSFGMRVIATRNSSREGPEFVAYVGLADELDKLLPQADVVVNALPLTDDTRGLFDRERFGLMKSTAFFINIGRGPTVATDDLAQVLKEGTIAGASVDVTEPEPLPKGHALWQAPNIIITPHISGVTAMMSEPYWMVIRENMRRYVAGEKLYSVVDLKRGY